jgi:hypothetical protein
MMDEIEDLSPDPSLEEGWEQEAAFVAKQEQTTLGELARIGWMALQRKWPEGHYIPIWDNLEVMFRARVLNGVCGIIQRPEITAQEFLVEFVPAQVGPVGWFDAYAAFIAAVRLASEHGGGLPEALGGEQTEKTPEKGAEDGSG